MQLEEILSKLQERFAPEEHKDRTLPGGGRWFYVPHQTITQRLNAVCAGEWHTKVGSTTVTGDYTIIILELTICGVTRTGIGDDKTFPELNDQGKSKIIGTPPVRAFRAAFKDACEQFGICAYLDDQKANRNAFAKYMALKGDMRAVKFEKENSEIEVGARGIAKPKEQGSILHDMSGVSPQKTISQAQAKRLWAIARNERGLSESDVKVIFAEFKIQSTSEILASDYDKVIERIQKFNVGF